MVGHYRPKTEIFLKLLKNFLESSPLWPLYSINKGKLKTRMESTTAIVERIITNTNASFASD